MRKADAAVWLRVAGECEGGRGLYSALAGDRCGGLTWERLHAGSAGLFGYGLMGASPGVQVLAACLLAAMAEAGDAVC